MDDERVRPAADPDDLQAVSLQIDLLPGLEPEFQGERPVEDDLVVRARAPPPGEQGRPAEALFGLEPGQEDRADPVAVPDRREKEQDGRGRPDAGRSGDGD